MNAGANPAIKSKRGKTAIEYAKKFPEVVAFLTESDDESDGGEAEVCCVKCKFHSMVL